MKVGLFFVFYILFFLLSSCEKRADVKTKDVSSVVGTIYSPDKNMFVKELNSPQRVVFFYQDHEGYTHYYNGKEDIIINKEVMDKYKKMGAVPLDFSYGWDGKSLYFSQPVRWSKKKLILIKMTSEGKVEYTKELSSLEEVIRPASFAFDGKGNMLMSWLDETPHYIKAAYMLVRGDQFPEKEEVIAFEDGPVLAQEPLYTEKGFAIVYLHKRKNISDVRIRFLEDGSEKTLYSGQAVDFIIVKDKEGSSYAMLPKEPSSTMKVILLGKDFEKKGELEVKSPSELASGSFGVAERGFLYFKDKPVILAVGMPPSSINVEGYDLPQKINVFISYNGSDFKRLSETDPYMFTQLAPSYATSQDYLLVAYSDRRFGLPSVSLAIVGTDGKIKKKDITLEEPGIRTGLPYVVYLGEGLFRVFYPVEDAKKRVWVYRSRDVRAESIKSLYELPSVRDREKKLKETVEKFIQCRKNKDYECVYSMLDPVYRQGVGKDTHIGMMRRVESEILDFRLEKCKVLRDSVIGVCDGYLKAKLPSNIEGRIIPESQRGVEQKLKGVVWVYYRGSWYYAVELPMLGYALQW